MTSSYSLIPWRNESTEDNLSMLLTWAIRIFTIVALCAYYRSALLLLILFFIYLFDCYKHGLYQTTRLFDNLSTDECIRNRARVVPSEL